ncbi:hypothetical protein GCM10023116_20300 [Kistimonas scapharcae]|uniref:site-specific DNA-methyltransferase (adenine-specific) n=1 Tax=Kistimonas scapharcae TaxID=1036133 RepID=A0ABP8V178_9GAMM
MDSLRKKGSIEDAISEISLLVAFCYIPVNRPELNFSAVEDVINGKLSLRQAYEAAAEALPDYATHFTKSRLPLELSSSEVINFIKEVSPEQRSTHWLWLQSLTDLSSRKNDGLYFIPDEIVNLMVSLAMEDKHAETVYSPFSLSVQLAVEASQKADEVIYESGNVSQYAAAIALLQGITLQKTDPISSPSNITEDNQLRKFSHILMAPPFGQKLNSVVDPYNRFQSDSLQSDVMTLEHGLAQCSGRMVALVPMGLLFRSGADGYFRERVVSSGILEAVIQLPGAIFSTTAIATCVLVFDMNRNPKDPVLFYNADNEELARSEGRPLRRIVHQWERIAHDVLKRTQSEYCVRANATEIKQQGYDLSVSRYVLSDATQRIKSLDNTRQLSGIAQLIRAQLLKEDKEPRGDVYLEVGMKDISPSGKISAPEKRLQLSGRARDRAKQQRLQPGDILLAIKGNLGKVGIVGNDCGDNWVAGQLFQVIRINSEEKVKTEYLYRYLSSPLVQTYLRDQASGTTMAVLKTTDIKALPIPVPSAEEQQQVLAIHQQIQQAYAQIASIQTEIDQLAQAHWNLLSAPI